MSGVAIGIDLGTTYSAVQVWRNNHVDPVPLQDGFTLASAVALVPGEERLYGEAAKQHAIQVVYNLENVYNPE